MAIIDFDGFRKFIDTIGGIDVDLPTRRLLERLGGAFNLKLDKGENHLDGFQAITLARTRENTCGSGDFTGTDVERAQFQQLILDGIKGKLTSITSLPMNFLRGPFIAWNAPKAMVSSMGALTDAPARDRRRDGRRRGHGRAHAVEHDGRRQPRDLTRGVRAAPPRS